MLNSPNAVGIPALIIDKSDIPKNQLTNSLITDPIHYSSTCSITGSGSGTGAVHVALSYMPPTLFFASA